MEKVKIRNMRKNDVEDVARIYMDVFNLLGENWSEVTAQNHMKDGFKSDTCWVAELDNHIIGFLMGFILPWDQGNVLFIDTINVKSNHQGNGVGKKLWNIAEKYSKTNSLKGIRLLANPDLESYKWYDAMGFKSSGWVDMYIDYDED